MEALKVKVSFRDVGWKKGDFLTRGEVRMNDRKPGKT